MSRELSKYIPQLRGLAIDARVEHELVLAFERMYMIMEQRISKLQEQLATSEKTVQQIQQSPLFSGALATPLITPGETIATAGIDHTITPDEVPDLDASKIVSGAFGAIDPIALTKLDPFVLQSDDGLAKTIAGAPYANDGFIIVKDNDGNNVKVMTTA